MGGWNVYDNRTSTKREMWVDRTKDSIARRIVSSPSCNNVLIDGIPQTITVVHRTTHTEKRICSMPGEVLKHGGLVDFKSSKWLITEVDTDTEVYQRGLMKRCNHLLRWISKSGELKEKWCVVEDGTKYLIGEAAEDKISIGDARIAVTIGKDEDTIELNRGIRFLIDDGDVEMPMAYQVTKPNRFFNITNGDGVFRFILNEVVLTDNDNVKERIADFKNWMPQRQLDGDHRDLDCSVAELVDSITEKVETAPPLDDKKGWL